MFTGLIEETGEIISFEQEADCWKLVIKSEIISGGCAIGDSIATNGCCLTVVKIEDKLLHFDLLDETVRLTAFKTLKAGSTVNLERALAVGQRLGGHFVSGHIDQTAEISVHEQRGNNTYIEVKTDPDSLKYVIYKGSITIDGISLTVAEVTDSTLSVWIIPHTLEMTNLKTLQAGSTVNLEFDMLAKYTEKLLNKQ